MRPLGLHSDDTQQALALLATATAADGWSPRTWASWLVAGARADAWRGTGPNFANAVASLGEDVPPERAGSASAGIGAAMRAGPLGAVFVAEPDTLARVVMQASFTTHADLRAAAVGHAVAEAVRRLVAGRSPDAVLAGLGDRVARVEAAWLHDPGDWTVDTCGGQSVSAALHELAAAPPADLDELAQRICTNARPHLTTGHTRIDPNQGFAMLAGLHGLVAGLLPCADPGKRLAEIVAQGYDTDTVGAICGSVLGACYGTTWLPLHRLVDGERLQRWADALAFGHPPPESQDTFVAHEAALTRRERRFHHQLTRPPRPNDRARRGRHRHSSHTGRRPNMRRHTIAGVTIELTTGDITAQHDIEAVVNAANAELLPGGGVAGAIHRAAGPALADECAPHAPIDAGQCVLTAGHRLPNPHVIHCLGPVYGLDEPADQLLADCYRNALLLADEHELASIAFPAISTGAFGYPIGQAAEVAVGTVAETASRLGSVTHIRFVLFDAAALDVHQQALARVADTG